DEGGGVAGVLERPLVRGRELRLLGEVGAVVAAEGLGVAGEALDLLRALSRLLLARHLVARRHRAPDLLPDLVREVDGRAGVQPVEYHFEVPLFRERSDSICAL